MIEKHTNNSYKHSPQKSAKSFAKVLDTPKHAFIIFSNKQQATSNKQQATSNKQQATSNKQQATSNKRHKLPLRPNKFTPKHIQIFSKQPWFNKGNCAPLKPPAFCRGKERHLSDASFPFSPYAPLSPFQRCQRGHPFGKPIRKQKGIQTKISKELRLFKKIYTIRVCVYRKLKARLEPKAGKPPAQNTSYEFLRMQKLEAQECTGRTFLGGVLRGRAPKQTEKDGGVWGGRKT